MHLLMIIELLARELALANFVLILMRGDAVFGDAVAVAVFHGLGHVGGVLRFVAMPWSGGIRSFRGRCRCWRLRGRGGGGGGSRWVGGVVEGCGADCGGCGEPRGVSMAFQVGIGNQFVLRKELEWQLLTMSIARMSSASPSYAAHGLSHTVSSLLDTWPYMVRETELVLRLPL